MAKASHVIRIEEVAELMGVEVSIADIGEATSRGGSHTSERRSAKSILAVLVGHAKDHVKKMTKLGYSSILERVANDPFYCFNMAQQALTPKAMAFLNRLADAMIPSIDRTREEILMGIGRRYTARMVVVPMHRPNRFVVADEVFLYYKCRLMRVPQFAAVYADIPLSDRFLVQGQLGDFSTLSEDAATVLEEMNEWIMEEIAKLISPGTQLFIGEQKLPRGRGDGKIVSGAMPAYSDRSVSGRDSWTPQERANYFGQWTDRQWEQWTQQRTRYVGYRWESRR